MTLITKQSPENYKYQSWKSVAAQMAVELGDEGLNSEGNIRPWDWRYDLLTSHNEQEA